MRLLAVACSCWPSLTRVETTGVVISMAVPRGADVDALNGSLEEMTGVVISMEVPWRVAGLLAAVRCDEITGVVISLVVPLLGLFEGPAEDTTGVVMSMACLLVFWHHTEGTET